jgi:hypothetical protein
VFEGNDNNLFLAALKRKPEKKRKISSENVRMGRN